MIILEWVGCGVLILAFLGATGLLVGAIFRSPMDVDDECRPVVDGLGVTKASRRLPWDAKGPVLHS